MKDLNAIVRGNQIPKGKVKVSGAKNSATKVLAASLISDENVILENFPTELVDANHKISFIKKSGGDISIDSENEILTINASNLYDKVLDDYNFPIRTTYLLVPGLLKRSKIAKIPYPGGCKIGNRGYDLHIMVWEKLGARVNEKEDYIEVSAPNGLIANTIDFPITTIGGTESALICGSIAEGTTYIKNAYISPEIQDLINFLKSMGIKITTVGNSYIEVIGKKFISGTIFPVMPDRIEALTWIIYGILSGGDITIEDIPFHSMEIPLIHLKEAGIDLYSNSRSIHISPDCLINGVIQPFELATGTHPGVISDMQPFFVMLALYADGKSKIFDYRYPERIKYCGELLKFYKNQIVFSPGEIIVSGNPKTVTNGSKVFSTDLRGSMAMVISALLSNGVSEIKNVEMALRGYNKLEEKLNQLGVKIDLIQE